MSLMPQDKPDVPHASLGALASAQPDELSKGTTGGGRGRPALGRWVRDILISLAVSAFFIIFLYQPVKVEGTSMLPTLEDQERVFINKFVYRLEPVERGDVVV